MQTDGLLSPKQGDDSAGLVVARVQFNPRYYTRKREVRNDETQQTRMLPILHFFLYYTITLLHSA